ncbi:MAG: 3-phosphoshikimate 1-carboxyvinyltransferase [Tissierellia bacterium]|nr:3-phosphoshikimate 1-carboxyvinyltransferase [Tissierellia bacterium]
MKVIFPRASKIRGRITAPPSKSMAHRLLLCAALAPGRSTVARAGASDDVKVTLNFIRALGISVEEEGEKIRIQGGGAPGKGRLSADMRESGTTLRLAIPILWALGREGSLSLRGRLGLRPLGVYEDLAARRGLQLERTGSLLEVSGQLFPGDYQLDGSVSSQFISGMLLALSLLPGRSSLSLRPPVVSEGYIHMTLAALRAFGVEVAGRGTAEAPYLLGGRGPLHPGDHTVEGDHSSAVFFEALNALGHEVHILGLDKDSHQPDRRGRELMEALMSGETVDLDGAPDLGPVLFALAALTGGGEFTGTQRLHQKESDRIRSMAEELEKVGAKVVEESEGLTVTGASHPPRGIFSSHGDHRILMALSLVALHFGGTVAGAESIKKSFPEFWEALRQLKIDFSLAP